MCACLVCVQHACRAEACLYAQTVSVIRFTSHSKPVCCAEGACAELSECCVCTRVLDSMWSGILVAPRVCTSVFLNVWGRGLRCHSVPVMLLCHSYRPDWRERNTKQNQGVPCLWGLGRAGEYGCAPGVKVRSRTSEWEVDSALRGWTWNRPP